MAVLPDAERYDGLARTLHWLTVCLIVAQFGIAWTMPDIHRGTQPVGLIAWHLSLGIAILVVTLLRGGWRLAHGAPPPPATLAPALKAVSRVTHFALYALLLALPLLGWANASSRGWPVTLFWVVPLPPLAPKGSALGHSLGDIHQLAAWVLLGVIALHVLGALYHLFVVRDRTVARMV
jgi:cytochrome b561